MNLEILSLQDAENLEQKGEIKFVGQASINLNSENYQKKLEETAERLQAYIIGINQFERILDPPHSSSIFAKFYKRYEGATQENRMPSEEDYQMAVGC